MNSQSKATVFFSLGSISSFRLVCSSTLEFTVYSDFYLGIIINTEILPYIITIDMTNNLWHR